MSSSRRFGRVSVAAIILTTLGGVVVATPCLFCSGVYLGFFDTPIQHRGVEDPARDFERITGLNWAPGAKVIAVDDSHWDGKSGPCFACGPGMLDGELYIVFDAAPEVVRQWLDRSAPWDATWKEGPVPDQIIGKTHFCGLTTTSMKYAVRERGSSDKFGHQFAFWDGELLMIDESSGRVWLSSWDM